MKPKRNILIHTYDGENNITGTTHILAYDEKERTNHNAIRALQEDGKKREKFIETNRQTYRAFINNLTRR
jgi:hypothetical protein